MSLGQKENQDLKVNLACRFVVHLVSTVNLAEMALPVLGVISVRRVIEDFLETRQKLFLVHPVLPDTKAIEA